MNSPTSVSQNTERYHDLDAIRAWAMIVGILFHAAWLYMPQYFYTPADEVSSTNWLSYFFCASHTFRMQLFFLVAGFFGNLVLQRRGLRSFIINRLLRIALPLVVFTVLLVPLIYYQYNVGGLVCGRIQSSSTAWEITTGELQAITVDTLNFLHLWFLYYLLLLYAVTLLARTILTGIDRNGNLTRLLTRRFHQLAQSPWLLPVFIAVSAILMMFSVGWWGIDSPTVGLKPHWRVLAEFWLFFIVGWGLYSGRELLPRVAKGYTWKCVVGGLLTIPLFFWWTYADARGWTTWAYPHLDPPNITDYSSLRQQLVSARDGTAAERCFQLLPPEYQEFIQCNATVTPDQVAGVATAINTTIIVNTEYVFKDHALQLTKSGHSLATLEDSERTPSDTALLNRLALEAVFGQAIAPQDRTKPNYWWVRAAYALTYSTAMWLLVFGSLGLFRRFFQSQNAWIRYVSDASYWMYLVHINLLFFIQYLMRDLNWPWPLKFSLLLVICFAIMIPSYHLLVRGTWIGWLLNGRRASSKASSIHTANSVGVSR